MNDRGTETIRRVVISMEGTVRRPHSLILTRIEYVCNQATAI